MKLTIFDPTALMHQITLDDEPTWWGRDLWGIDTKTSQALVVVRDFDGNLVRVPPNTFGAQPWLVGDKWVLVDTQPADICITHLTMTDTPTQHMLATWHGRIDRGLGKTNWAKAHYDVRYKLVQAYDRGYQTNPSTWAT